MCGFVYQTRLLYDNVWYKRAAALLLLEVNRNCNKYQSE